jgi:hypothetical protein
MRDYSKVAPTFWTGDTGRLLRKLGRDEQLLALYLITCPSANMIGLYHLPMVLIVNDLGWSLQGASKALQRVCETGFCRFEGGREEVFVVEMAAQQVGDPLEKKDLRVKGIIKEWQARRKSSFYLSFYERYSVSYHLPEPSPFEAPSKPLRSQEQEQEQDIEQEQDTPLPPKGGRSVFVVPTVDEVAAYCLERGNAVDPQVFVDHYTANGWKVGGKTPMKDWQASVRTWEKNSFRSGQSPLFTKPTIQDKADQSWEDFKRGKS